MGMARIIIVNTNEGKTDTCGSCKHTDNNIGFVALHCALIIEEAERIGDEDEDGKVRSWNECIFEPSKYEPRTTKKVGVNDLKKFIKVKGE